MCYCLRFHQDISDHELLLHQIYEHGMMVVSCLAKEYVYVVNVHICTCMH